MKMIALAAGMPPRIKARITGVCQLLESLTATFGQVIILGRLVVAGNAAATAANIMGHQQLYWLGFASSLLGVVFHIVWALLFYDLFKPVNRNLSLLAAFIILVGCAIQALTGFLYLAPLLVLQSGGPASAFTAEQLHALALIFLKLNTYSFNMELVFFGFWCILSGYLIFRATFMPRIMGVMLMISGLGWIIFLVPPVAAQLFPIIAVASVLGEVPLELWLIIKGVNTNRWKEQAGALSGAQPASAPQAIQV